MKSTRVCLLAVTFLLVTCAGLAARLDRWFMRWPGNRADSFNPLTVFIGEGQKIFATHFYRKADVYFHSGMYPTIFDNTESFRTAHMAEDAGAAASHNEGDEAQYLGKPLDIIDDFSRHFFPSEHVHLGENAPTTGTAANPELGEGTKGEVREVLPWLRLAAALDPEMPETYTVTAYWLRRKMGKVREAEIFLREALKSLPGHPAILFELGRIYFEDYKDPARARNVWRQGLVEWQRQEGVKSEPDRFIFLQLHAHLARLDEDAGNLAEAIAHWDQILSVSPSATSIQARIAELRKKQAAVPPPK
jgi:tetratricopeptide (TPR) repeat protein